MILLYVRKKVSDITGPQMHRFESVQKSEKITFTYYLRMSRELFEIQNSAFVHVIMTIIYYSSNV